MDDLFLQCSTADWTFLMGLLTDCLAAVGLECRLDKSHCFVPDATADCMQANEDSFSPFAKLCATGLPVLGAVADGEFSATVNHSMRDTTQIEQRLHNAEKLCGHIAELCEAPIAGVRCHPAWRLPDSVVNHSLSYDVSVSGPGCTQPFGRRLDELVVKIAATILQEGDLPPEAERQMRLSREAGGCSIRSATDRCHTAFLATAIRLGPCWRSSSLAGGLFEDIGCALKGLAEMGCSWTSMQCPTQFRHPRQCVSTQPNTSSGAFRNDNGLGGNALMSVVLESWR